MTSQPEAASALHGKVFGLGLARTGTTSLHEAMQMLGLRSCPTSAPLIDGIDLTLLGDYDAFFDNPIPFLYEQLGQACPNSKWIVTERPLEQWLASMQSLFGAGLDRLDPATRQLGDRVHRAVYGIDTFCAERLSAIYEAHYRDVREFVADKPAVWLDTSELAWGPICHLLEVDVPRRRFPRSNARSKRWQPLRLRPDPRRMPTWCRRTRLIGR